MTGRPPLADLLALAILEHGPGPASKLALRVRARRADVVRELHSNERFERLGRGRGTRWRLALGSREQMGTEDRAAPGVDDPAAHTERLDVIERRLSELEHAVEGSRRA